MSPPPQASRYPAGRQRLAVHRRELATIGRKSGVEVTVQAGQTILEAVTAVGIDVPFSCEQGVCGSCEMRVLGGKPDHRDMILRDREKAEGRTMMICCSGFKAVRLVLGL